MNKHTYILSVIIFCALAIFQSGCSVMHEAILYGDLKFVHQNDYPEGTMSVSRATPYGVQENEKRFLTDAAAAWCKMKGKVMVPISVSFLPPHGDQPSHTTVLFRSMNPNDSTLQNPDISPIRRQTTYFR